MRVAMNPCVKPRVLAPLLVALAFALCIAPLHAQRPAPRVGFVYPAGGQAGTTFIVSVGGQNLDGTSAAHFSALGLSAKIIRHERPLSQNELNDLREKAQALEQKRAAARNDPTKPPFTEADAKQAAEIRELITARGNRQATPALAETVTLEVQLAGGAAVGEHELRLKTPGGLSNPLVFCVGQLHETGEPVVTAAANRGQARARIADARNGRPSSAREITLPAVCNGQILPGEVDRFRFAAQKGQRLVFAASARTLIPYLADAVPGWFQATLAVYDAAGRELAYGDDFRFSPDPVIACEIPADGTYTLEIKDAIYRGREDFIYRIAAGELPFLTGIFPLGGPTGDRARFALAGWNLPADVAEVDTTRHQAGTFTLSARNAGVLSNPMRFALDAPRAPVANAAPPRSDNEPTLTLPAVLDGRIERAGEEHVFRFAGKAGTEVVAEIVARRLGSPLDSILTLTDAAGRRLATNDDFEDKGAGLLTHHADSRISHTLPADGVYSVRIADTQRRGGPEYGYRLRVGPPQPDFELRVVPSSINVRAGATVPITVYALRRDGFTGEIALALGAGPKGAALSGARIPPHEDSIRLTLTAPSNAPEEVSRLILLGSARIADRQIVHAAVPAEDMMQAFAYRHLVAAKEWLLAVNGRGSSPRIVSPLPVHLSPHGEARVRVATSALKNLRQPRFELVEPPPGISVRRVVHKAEFAEIVLAVDPAQVKPGARGNLIFNAYGERANGPSSKSPARVQRVPLGIVPAVAFEVDSATVPSS